MELLERLTSNSPKRILALDGGGIRGAITLGFLEKLESMLRARHNNPALKLCDYFDLIGGTSTGSIIASGLAIGMDASQLKQMYMDLGGKIFAANAWWRKLNARYDPEQLRKELQNVFGDRTLGDPAIKTGLCIVTKRADTGSTWPLINHPGGAYFKHNEGMLLRRAIRASTAAPTYFEPEAIDVGFGEIGAFVDGGVSMANNPALLLFLLATVKGYPFHWPTGADNLLLISIGTGVWRERSGVAEVTDSKLWDWASAIPSMLMNDASWQNQLLLQCFSRNLTPWEIDREVGAGSCFVSEPLLTYVRYNAFLDENGLNKAGLGDLTGKLASLREMSNGENRFDLAKIGEIAASQQMQDSHLPPAFDLK